MLITKSLLSQAGKNFVENRSSKAMDEALGQAKRASRFGEISVFLSHQHDEVKELHDTIALLNSWASPFTSTGAIKVCIRLRRETHYKDQRQDQSQ